MAIPLTNLTNHTPPFSSSSLLLPPPSSFPPSLLLLLLFPYTSKAIGGKIGGMSGADLDGVFNTFGFLQEAPGFKAIADWSSATVADVGGGGSSGSSRSRRRRGTVADVGGGGSSGSTSTGTNPRSPPSPLSSFSSLLPPLSSSLPPPPPFIKKRNKTPFLTA